MLRILGAGAVLSLMAGYAAAAEPTHRFVSLGLEGLGVASFLDEAATRVDGSEIEIAVFDAHFEYKLIQPGEQVVRPIVGALRRYRVSCDWRAQRGPVSTSYYDSDGALLKTQAAETELQLSFYGKRAVFAPAIDKVCGWDSSKPSQSLASVKDVLAFATTVMKEPEPAPVSAPPPPPSTEKGKAQKVMMAVPVTVERKVTLPAFAEIAPHRFAVVARDEAKGHTLFLDWANMKREGDEVVALTLAVLGNESAPPPALQWRWPVLSLRSTRYDCKAGTVAVLGEAFGYKDLSLNPQPASDLPARPAAASPVASAALKAACGTEQGPTYSGVAEAFAFARAPK